MRGTIHLVSARDCLPLRELVQPVLDRALRGAYGKQLAGADTAAVAAAGREAVEAQPMTFSELGAALAGRGRTIRPPRWPRRCGRMCRWCRCRRAPSGAGRTSRHTSAEHWLGHPAGAAAESALTLPGLVSRYLAAFGPASVRDMAAWSGLTGLRPVLAGLRPSLVTFRDERGTELFDLPSAPRPGQDEPVPVRLAAEFDNLLLSHADRSRVVRPEDLRRFYTINGIFPGSVLIDGFAAGLWRLARAKGTATVTIELFAAARQRDEVAQEARRMLGFCAPEVTHEVRFASIA